MADSREQGENGRLDAGVEPTVLDVETEAGEAEGVGAEAGPDEKIERDEEGRIVQKTLYGEDGQETETHFYDSEGLVERVKNQMLREQRHWLQATNDTGKANRTGKRRGLQKVPEKRPWRK